MILFAPKHLKRWYHRYLKAFGFRIKTEGSLKIEEARSYLMIFGSRHKETAKLGLQRINVESSEIG